MADEIENTGEKAPEIEVQTEQTAAPIVEKQHDEIAPWVKGRFADLTNKRKAAEARAQQLEEQIRTLQAQQQQQAPVPDYTGIEQPAVQSRYQPTQAEIDQLVNQRAQQLAAQQVNESAFTARLNDIEREAKTKYGAKFDTALNNLQELGVINRDFLTAVSSVDNSDAVLTFLGQGANLEEANRIAAMNPFQMGAALSKLSSTAGKALNKQVSSAPAPIEDIPAGGSAKLGAEPKVGSKEWIVWRNQQARERGRR